LNELSIRRAIFIYESCRLEAIGSNRPIVPETWNNRDQLFKIQFIKTIERLCDNNAPPTTPEAEHDSWMKAYEDMGWKYGPIRDTTLKTHPDMVPFDQLPKAEQIKDEIFLTLCDFAKKYIK